MTFSSLIFLGFVALCVIVYYIMPHKLRWTVLLAGSYAFYLIVCAKYIGFMILTTATTFGGALLIDGISSRTKSAVSEHKQEWTKEYRKAFKDRAQRRKRWLLIATLVLNFGILCFLKYYNFFADTVSSVIGVFGINASLDHLGLLLPLGISFYTFQSTGYVIDVYRCNVQAQKNIGKFALFVSFFPQIVQGPIAFYSDLAQQLYEPHTLKYENIKHGAELILWGFFKKLIIADRAVGLIKTVTGGYEKFSGTFVLLAALMYALQLYADFSGGIDIARGVAQLFGINMAENFRRPYFSRSLTEYWHRWHITLGAWLRTYLFYPISISKPFLNMGKKLKAKVSVQFGKIFPTALASLITFLVIGIWHGASWKYVAFGLFNGLVIMVSSLLEPSFDKLKSRLRIKNTNAVFIGFQMVRTFIIVLIGYYFDIAGSFIDAMKMLWKSVSNVNFADFANTKAAEALGLDLFDWAVILFGLLVILTASIVQEKSGKNIRDMLAKKPFVLEWAVMLAGIVCVVLLGVYGPGASASDFVYMQF